jgi:regulator of RNase E activity RraA
MTTSPALADPGQRSATTAPPPGAKPGHTKLHPGPGFRLRANDIWPDATLVRRLACFDTPEVSDLQNRLYTMNVAIGPITPGLRIVAPACTVKVFPGDNLMVHKALDIARRGDVIVVDAGASTLTAVLGDTVCMKARHRGIAGFIVDGLIRDLPGILRLRDFPVFARGVTPIGPLQRGPGEINHPVSVGGIVVSPGDVVVADENGVVVVQREALAGVVERLETRAPAEEIYLAEVARGEFSNAWIDDVLDASGAVIPEDVPRAARADGSA